MPSDDNPDAPAERASRYARPERERRFLLPAAPSGEPVRRYLIEDRYIAGSRLRLRRATDLDHPGGPDAVVRKLAQKVPAVPNGPVLLTNLYLSEAEYDLLAALPAHPLRKVRESFPPYGVDTFSGPLAGLVLAEVEFDNEEDLEAFRPDIAMVAEVSGDERFTGGRLAVTSARTLADLLAEFGIGDVAQQDSRARHH